MSTRAAPSLRRSLTRALLHGVAMLLLVALLQGSLHAAWQWLLQAGVTLLGLQATVQSGQLSLFAGLRLPVVAIDAGLPSPHGWALALHGLILAGATVTGWLVRHTRERLARVLWAIALLYTVALAGWLWAPQSSAHSLLEHTRTLSGIIVALLFLLPLPLCASLAALGFSTAGLWRVMARIGLALVVLLPLQLLSHAVIASHLSVNALPALFLLGGPLADVFVLLAMFGASFAATAPPPERRQLARLRYEEH
ncbi:hypothetical protein [Uliginosibacterium sp. H1]|uniref:hypothetical protein n=1 Tax=Uliginosibacterium sp. H1 TaxID=3114757 RepID=UPI002E192783|nr:hypothetical protein [Uliginosibacterium sp. H1]